MEQFLETDEPRRFALPIVVLSLLVSGSALTIALLWRTPSEPSHPSAVAHHMTHAHLIESLVSTPIPPEHLAASPVTPSTARIITSDPPDSTAPVPESPAPTREGLTWSLDDLADYLGEHCQPVNVARRMTSTTPGIWLSRPGKNDQVLVTIWPNAASAAQAARKEQPNSLAWGRFALFGAHTPLWISVRAVLIPPSTAPAHAPQKPDPPPKDHRSQGG